MKRKRLRANAKYRALAVIRTLAWIEEYEPKLSCSGIHNEYPEFGGDMNSLIKQRKALAVYVFIVLPHRLARRVVQKNWRWAV